MKLYNNDIKRYNETSKQWKVVFLVNEIQISEAKLIELYNQGPEAVLKLVKELYIGFNSLSAIGLEQRKCIEELTLSNLEMKAKIIELEARLNKNSDNSSKPPSSDGYNKKTITNSREKSGRKTGGQPGHEGTTLNKVENPNKRIEIKVADYCDCGQCLKDVTGNSKTRQVFDIPPINKIEVTEYLTEEKKCPICGKFHKTEFPAGVSKPTQYGENMKTLMAYFNDYQLLPLQRTVEAISDLTGQRISEGTIVNAGVQLQSSLKETLETIKEEIFNSDVVHFDETGIRIQGKTKWMHVACTETSTYYEVNDKRGIDAINDIGILREFTGTAVHDHWKPYYDFKNCTHSECNAHVIRYLKDIHQNYKQDWACNMAGLLIELKRLVESLKTQGLTCMESQELELWRNKYHKIISEGIIEDDEKSPKVFNKKGKLKNSKARQLLNRLGEYDIETLAFMYDFTIPFDNNLAERDLRMQKLRQKISGCFRGKDGANVFCDIRSYISTARKRGYTAFEAIRNAIKGEPDISKA